MYRNRDSLPTVIGIGTHVGRWRVLYLAYKRGEKKKWLVMCLCLTIKEVRESHLKNGVSLSCGCLTKEIISTTNTTHGESVHGKNGMTAEYHVYRNIITRCCNPKSPPYERYGKIGITICDEWRHSYEVFLDHVGRRPTSEHTLDRYPKNNGNYEPGNVRWATRKEQARNRKDNSYLTFNGQTRLLVEWAELKDMKPGTLGNRISCYGWSVERALTQPVRQSRIDYERGVEGEE